MAKPEWLVLEELPPLAAATATDAAGIARETLQLIDWLQAEVPAPAKRTFDDPNPPQPWRRGSLPPAVAQRCEAWRARHGAVALDRWMTALLRQWLERIGSGTARKHGWVVPAAALLGGDGCAALLGPHLRGENHALRCTGEIGVAALIEMGTRGALLELAQIAAKCATRSRGQAAAAALETLAAAQGLSIDQLQDRVLPSCGLDENGQRAFSYGPRQFALMLDETVTPVLRAPDGRRISALPKPNARDDAVQAAQARSEWKTAKAQIQQAARWLARRFEQAMIAGEAWAPADFAGQFRAHPLARHILRRLLWTTIDREGRPATRFRIAEDDTLADATDASGEMAPGTTGVRPVHPLELSADELGKWQRIFADYQIVGPFQQLDRATFVLSDQQRQQRVFRPFRPRRVEAKALIFPLESRGWSRGDSMSGGLIEHHTRTFARAELTACLEYEPGAFVGDITGADIQTLTALYFVRAGDRQGEKHALPLGSTPAILCSEVLRDLHGLVPAP